MTEHVDFSADTHIDEQALDVEWLNQSDLMYKYCRIEAAAHRRADLAKMRVEVRYAQLDRAIRSDPDGFGISRISNEAISSAVKTDPEYTEALVAEIEARYEQRMASSAVRALMDKKSALENLVRLFGMSYFSGPRVPRDIQEARKQRDTSVQQQIRMRRRRE